MGIPSTKASTANVDAGTDLISNARPDIKQNIDNVNEIIDHLTDSVTQKYAQITGTNTEQNVTGNIYRKAVTVDHDIDSFITNSTYTFSLPAGKYMMWTSKIPAESGTADPTAIQIHDEDSDTQLGQFTTDEVGTTTSFVYESSIAFSLASATNISYRVNSSSTGVRNISNTGIIIHKFQ